MTLKEIKEDKMEYKYSLIVSQCYHQHHQFIVKMVPDFVERAKKMLAELKEYKGSKNTTYLGDLEWYKDEEVHKRYNYNGDEGDVYIINSKTILSLIKDFKRFNRQEVEGVKFSSGREVWEHLYEKVESIVKKYFEIM